MLWKCIVCVSIPGFLGWAHMFYCKMLDIFWQIATTTMLVAFCCCRLSVYNIFWKRHPEDWNWKPLTHLHAKQMGTVTITHITKKNCSDRWFFFPWGHIIVGCFLSFYILTRSPDFNLVADLNVISTVFCNNECVTFCIVGRDGCRSTVTFRNHKSAGRRAIKRAS